MKNMKKLAAIVLALIMVLSLTATALATDGTYDQETSNTAEEDVFENYDTTNSKKVQFDAFPVISELDKNAALEAYGATAFTYTLAAGQPVAVSETAGENKIAVYAGPSGAVLNDGTNTPAASVTIPFPTDDDATTEKTFKVDLSGVTWPHAGIYRYTLTQAAMTSEQLETGFQSEAADGKASVEKYIDVYVADVDTTGNSPSYKVLNTVLAGTLPNVLTVGDNYLVHYDTPNYNKTDRFINTVGDPVKDTTDPNSGKSTTNIIIVTKVVDGNMGDKTYKFPFDLTVYYTEPTTDDANTTLVNTLFKVENNGTAATIGLAAADAKITSTASAYHNAFSLADGESVKITVPNNVIVKVQEAVESYLGYTVSSAITEDSGLNDGSTPKLSGEQPNTPAKKTDETGITGDKVAYTEMDTSGATPVIKPVALTWTNFLDSISPTGVVLRVAPYALMLFAGMFLIILAKRRKDEDEVEA